MRCKVIIESLILMYKNNQSCFIKGGLNNKINKLMLKELNYDIDKSGPFSFGLILNEN